MIFFKIILWLFIIPYVLGKFLERKNENNILFSWVLGYVVEMGVCLLWAIPMIIARIKFDVLLKCYDASIYVLVVLSIFINRKKIIPRVGKKIKLTFWQCMAVLLVLLLIFVKFRYTHINNDDSSFIVLGANMIENGYMYCDGDGTSLNLRRALAPISAYFSILSQNIGIHVTIVSHTIEPIIFMAIGGIIFYNFGKILFKEDKDSPYIFVVFMLLLYTYFFTTKGAGLYFLKFTWFGRALIGAVFLPLLWKIMLEIFDDKDTIQSWITVFCIVLASCLSSEMAIALIPISLIVMATIASIRNKKISYVAKSLVCILPCTILGITYVIIQNIQ